MQKISISQKCLLLLLIFRALLGVHVSRCSEIWGNSRVILKYPNYSGLEEDAFEIISGRTLGDYISIGEKKLSSLFGTVSERGGMKVRVNEVDLESSEFGHKISDFVVSRNEDVVVELMLSDNLMEGQERSQEGEKEMGQIVLMLYVLDEDGQGEEKILKSISVGVRFPMKAGDLKLELERQIDQREYSIESVTVFGSSGVDLLWVLETQDEDLGLELWNGCIVKVQVRELQQGRDLGEAEKDGGDSRNDLPVMILFSNRRAASSQTIRLGEDSTVGELIERLHRISYEKTNRAVISLGERFSIQNEQGMEVIQEKERILSEFIPEGLEVSESRPLVLYVTVFGKEDGGRDFKGEVSEIFEHTAMDETLEKRIMGIDREVGEVETIIQGRSAGIWIEFIDITRDFSFRIRSDAATTTFASVYSVGQLFWSTIRDDKEKNCLLVFERDGKEEYLDPNEHETLTRLKDAFRGELRLQMRKPKKVRLEIQVYKSVPGKERGESREVERVSNLRLEVPEVISVLDFMKRLGRKKARELSKYLIVGIQKKLEEDRVVEYLPIPRTPSSTTYLVFSGKSDLSVFLEVAPARSMEIMLMVPDRFGGEEISKLGESSDPNEDLLVEYTLKVASNTSVRELINGLVRDKVLGGVSSTSIFIKDYVSKEYLSRDYILGHHLSEGVGERKTKERMVFEVEVMRKVSFEVSFYYPQGEEYPIESYQISMGPGQKIKKLREQIVSHLSSIEEVSSRDKFGIGSGEDIGEEFRKVVYSIAGEDERIMDCGFHPNERLRVYLLRGEMEKEGEGETELKMELLRASAGEGPKLEVPLSLEGCPLNTLLERRWFILQMTLDTPLRDLRREIERIAMLGGVEFDLYGETEKGRIKLGIDSESFQGVGVSELGHLTVVCNEKGGKSLVRERELQVEIPGGYGDSGSKRCVRSSEKKTQGPAAVSGGEEGLVEYDSVEESDGEEPHSREEENEEALRLLKRIEDKVHQLEEREIRLKRNRKLIEKLLKEDADSSREELREKDLAKLLREFLSTYVSRGASGLGRFCRKQGPERMEQLVAYISTPEGKKTARKIAKRVVERERRAKRRRIPENYNPVTEIEYTVLPNVALYSDSDGDSLTPREEDISESIQPDFGDADRILSRSQGLARSRNRRPKKSSGTSRRRGSARHGLNGDLDPVTKVQKKKKKAGKLRKLFKKIPVISPIVSTLYSRLSAKGRKKRRARKYILEILQLEIQFRKKAYGSFQEQEFQDTRGHPEEEFSSPLE